MECKIFTHTKSANEHVCVCVCVLTTTLPGHLLWPATDVKHLVQVFLHFTCIFQHVKHPRDSGHMRRDGAENPIKRSLESRVEWN